MKRVRYIVLFLFIGLLGGTVYFGYDFVKSSKATTYDNTNVIKAIEKIQIKSIKSTENKNSKASENNATIPLISEKDLEVLLKTVAYDARKEAAEEYKNNFNTLLTILTIFGIALPLIIALVNFTINEHQMAKVDEASDKADKASEQANKASNKAEENNKKTEELQKRTKKIASTVYIAWSDMSNELAESHLLTTTSTLYIVLRHFNFAIERLLVALSYCDDNTACNKIYKYLNDICDKIDNVLKMAYGFCHKDEEKKDIINLFENSLKNLYDLNEYYNLSEKINSQIIIERLKKIKEDIEKNN